MPFFTRRRRRRANWALEILDWYRAHTDAVRVEPTQIFQDEMTLRENPGHRPARDLGERAAIEIIRNYPLAKNARALLLSGDRDAERLVAIEPENTILLTTWDYLRQLEEAQRIHRCGDRACPGGRPSSAAARSMERS